MANLPSNATSSIRGILYQFIIALEKCFELVEGQSIYIEKYGDVTISEVSQIEVKLYDDVLTDMHHNIWKTLKNWLHPDFNESHYQSLIVLTTQELSVATSFNDWNRLDEKSKFKKLVEISGKYRKDVKKRNEGKTDIIKSPTEKFVDFVMDDSRIARLKEILGKFVILTNAPILTKKYTEIEQKYTKFIPEEQKYKFMNEMFGYVINPINSNKSGWEITYDDFSLEMQKSSDLYRRNTVLFPKLIKKDFNESEYEKHLFVTKINEIKHYDEISSAIDDYTQALNVIMDDFKTYQVHKTTYDSYECNIEYIHEQQFRRAQRKCKSENTIEESQDFYDNFTSHTNTGFDNLGLFTSTPVRFRNGVIHILANEEGRKIKWILKI